MAPSDELRTWFGHDPDRWAEFRRRYAVELDAREAEIDDLLARVASGRLTLVYSARDETHNQAVALAAYLRWRIDAAATADTTHGR